MREFFSFFLLSGVLLVIGFWGIFIMRTNVLIILLSIELMFLGISLNFVLFSVYLNDIIGQLFTLLILTIAAAESAIGLAIFVSYHRIGESVAISYLHSLKG